MFTGLIEDVGELVARTATSGGFRLRIATRLSTDLTPGDSLAVNGVCLTVIRADAANVEADIGPETVRVTTLGTIARGAPVNLERPLRADGRFGGHFVLGHVDGIGTVDEFRPDAEFRWLGVRYPRSLAPYFVMKGSVAVDGISLTVAALETDRFDVQIVPYTTDHTNLRGVQVGDRVNLECDMVGKYVARGAEVARLSGSALRPGEVAQ